MKKISPLGLGQMIPNLSEAAAKRAGETPTKSMDALANGGNAGAMYPKMGNGPTMADCANATERTALSHAMRKK